MHYCADCHTLSRWPETQNVFFKRWVMCVLDVHSIFCEVSVECFLHSKALSRLDNLHWHENKNISEHLISLMK